MKDLLERFCALVGFPPVPVSPQQTARLCFGNDLYVDMDWPKGSGLHLVSNPISFDAADAGILAEALRANAPTRSASQPILFLANHELFIRLVIPENEISAEQLAVQLELLLETIEKWQDIIRNGVGSDGGQPLANRRADNSAWKLRA